MAMSEDIRNRVETEREELEEKIKKCGAFVYSDKSKDLDSKALELLKKQLRVMEQYDKILIQRLELG